MAIFQYKSSFFRCNSPLSLHFQSKIQETKLAFILQFAVLFKECLLFLPAYFNYKINIFQWKINILQWKINILQWKINILQ